MPPRRRPVNVVRSGNAGNSSKAKKDDPKDAKGKDKKGGKDGGKDGGTKEDEKPARPPPLFPVGYKSPVTILNEKCQKMGWERPIIDTVSVRYWEMGSYSTISLVVSEPAVMRVSASYMATLCRGSWRPALLIPRWTRSSLLHLEDPLIAPKRPQPA